MISYQLLADSILYYEGYDFKQIEVPWTVTESIARITMPIEVKAVKLEHNDGKVLIGSAEQGFLYLLNKGFLPPGKYQSISPCFRSDSHDETHSKFFMKNELIVTNDSINYKNVKDVVDCVIEFMKKYSRKKLEIVDTGLYTMDIVTEDGIEVGSYGYRECSFAKWIYGTGLAEPRFSRFCKG